MSVLKFKKIEISNFLSFGDDVQTYEFRDNGLVLILGKNKDIKTLYDSSNGAGKTSFVNALFWALFGETDKRLKADAVVNNINNRDCFVKLTFLADDNIYRIERYRNHRKFKNSLKLFKDNEEITQTASSLTQNIINSLIGDSKTFLNSIMFSQELIVNFLKLRIGDRKSVIEKILQLERLNDIQDRLKEKYKNISDKKEQIEIKKKEIENSINTLNETLKNYFKECKEKGLSIKKELSEAEEELKQIENINIVDLKKIKENCDLLKEEYNNFSFNYEKKENFKKNYLQLLKERKTLKKEIEKQNKKINEYLQNPKRCPVCGNQIEKEKFDKFIKSLKNDVKKKRQKVKEIEEKQVKIKNQIKELLDFSLSKFYKIKTELLKIEKEIEKNKKTIDKLEEIDNFKNELQSKIQNLRNSLKNIFLKSYAEKIKEQIEEKKKQIPFYENEIKEYDEELANYEFWINALDIKNEKGIKNYIMNVNLPLINQRLEYYLLSIFSYPISVRFNSSFGETIILEGKKISYSNLSGGEKKRLDLAINLTLFDLVRLNFNKTNILIMDEVLDQLDKEGQQTFLNILKTISENYAVYLISHSKWIKDNENLEIAKESLSELFDQIILVEKRGGFSKLNIL